MPSLQEATDTVDEYAVKWMKATKEALENASYDVSSIQSQRKSLETEWSIAAETADGDMLVSFRLIDSEEYEGERYGYNVSVEVVLEDGQILHRHVPLNYTEDVWTTELQTLEERAKYMPQLGDEDIQQLPE